MYTVPMHAPSQRPHDEAFMARACALAARALGRTSPNPPVGALIVDESGPAPIILAEGFHARAGADHAEVAALRQLGGAHAQGRTLYVTLEPCNHVGRTGRCTDAILKAGIARVVIGARDPNPTVAGHGADRLRAAGLDVTVGVAGAACQRLIRPFSRWIRSGLPYFLLKAALSLDGRIAPAPAPTPPGGPARGPVWLTGPEAQARAHELRDACDAVLVGAGTVLADDPLLTVRLPGPHDGRQPLRVVLDGALRTPPDARLCAPGTLILTSEAAAAERGGLAKALRDRGAEVVALPVAMAAGPAERPPARRTDLDPRAVASFLGRRQLLSVLCEGGAGVHGAFLRAGLYDEAALFLAPLLLGDRGVPLLRDLDVPDVASAPALREPEVEVLGRDLLVRGMLRRQSTATATATAQEGA
jgi:diaminohydroxyphosphoribosylaminopyrimidine deaminase/5-amino-6-(5-phosphoribosylamino)uracil reductase